MKRPKHGPSLYFASDKNIFDALNQHKVDAKTVVSLFERRNIIASSETSREELSTYFSQLQHDYYDHQDISSKLGIIPRRERIATMQISGAIDKDSLKTATSLIKKELEEYGDVVHTSEMDGTLTLSIQYSFVDYKRSEFTQVQVRDGLIEFVKSDDGYIVRCSQNEYISEIRDNILLSIEESNQVELSKHVISLFDVPSPRLRSKFFHELAFNLDGYKKIDVTDVHVFKPKPVSDDDDDDDKSGGVDVHIERVLLKGNEVTRSQLLNDLLDQEDYYIVKIRWTSQEELKRGYIYDIEAVFDDPKDCSSFSFILKGVFERDNGVLASRKRAPNKSEIEDISKVIESKARTLITSLRDEYHKV